MLCSTIECYPLAKIIQSFVLMQNTWKRDCLWRGDFWCPFSKRCHFWPISNAVLNFQNIVCKVVRKFVFKPPHSLFSSLLNERFSGSCIQMYFVTVQVKALQKFYELSTPTTVVDFLKWLCCGCCFENVTHYISLQHFYMSTTSKHRHHFCLCQKSQGTF